MELVARDKLNPALSDLLLEVAPAVHGRASLLQKRGEFPAPEENDFPVSEDAQRYYKSGKGVFYRAIPSFWLASLASRLLVVGATGADPGPGDPNVADGVQPEHQIAHPAFVTGRYSASSAS